MNDPPVRNSQEAFMMEMRAARMVRVVVAFLSLYLSLSEKCDCDILYLDFELAKGFMMEEEEGLKLSKKF